LKNLAACETLPQAVPTGNALAISVQGVQTDLERTFRCQKERVGKLFYKEAYMRTIAKKTVVMLLVVVFATTVIASSSFAQAVIQGEEISTENMVADAVLVRPLGLCAIVLGAGLFIISLPFSALGKNVKEAGQKLVVAPVKFTFTRPLGEF
jgi:hypothetical protein